VFFGRRNLKNYLSHKRMCSDHGTWGMMTAAAHNFGIVIHYTTLAAASAELRDAGFTEEPIVFESGSGHRVISSAGSHAWWFHLVVRG